MNAQRLSKALAAAGVASRRAAEELIFAGKVQVNGTTVRVPQTLVSWEKDRIAVHGKELKGAQKKLCFIFHKPWGVICSNVRVGNRPIVRDFFPGIEERLFPVGRLDRETTGLLLVTNDGALAHAIIHPSANIEKEYLVKVDCEIAAEHLEALSRGACIDDRWVRPLFVHKVRRGTFKISVKEGKKHEVRILAEKARLRILSLTRIRIGNLLLGHLQPGAFRPLTEKDRELL
jgi:23S rRNA pseudouridine2605 synthase